jgi:hypothetical protein
MATYEPDKPWFDLTVYLDGQLNPQANTFILPPELYLRLGNAAGARFTFQCTGIGVADFATGKVQLDLEACAALSDLRFGTTEVFQSFWTNTAMRRQVVTVPYAVGIEGGEDEGYPGGVFRLKVTNTDSGASGANWAVVRIHAWCQLIAA